jgi:hypothetical protein
VPDVPVEQPPPARHWSLYRLRRLELNGPLTPAPVVPIGSASSRRVVFLYHRYAVPVAQVGAHRAAPPIHQADTSSP